MNMTYITFSRSNWTSKGEGEGEASPKRQVAHLLSLSDEKRAILGT